MALLAVALLLAAGVAYLLARDSGPDDNLTPALRQEATERIEALPVRGLRATEIECGSLTAGRLTCPARLHSRDRSGRVVYHLVRNRETGELEVRSIKLSAASEQLLRDQF